MSLCATCQSVDILNIPKLPKDLGFNAQNESPVLVTIRTKHPRAEEEFSGPLGKKWHQSREELEASAVDCSICKVIEQDVSRFEAELEDARNNDCFQRRNLKGPDWQMWLASGENDVSGFTVLSADTENNIWVWVLSAVGLCVDHDDALNGVVRGRKIEADVTSDVTVQQASSWIQQSISDHGDAEVANVSSLPASRFLDVGNTTSGTISLHALGGAKAKYAALSHVRDMDQSSIIVSARRELEEGSVALSRLPQVYQDAITMTRKLGLQSLWIGALCDSQEDRADFSRTSTDIFSIFSNAYVTLSALRSSSDQGSMLAQRSPPSYISFPYTQDNTHGTVFAFSLNKEAALYPGVYRILAHEPLSQHGWALQDRLFSPRILHFGTSQLYFECNTHFFSEDGFQMTGRHDTIDIEDLSDATASTPSQANITWQRVLSLYRKRQLPKPTDTLPALSNIARHLAEQTGDIYLAGLWRAHLIDGLIWQATGHARGLTSEAPSYRAPSWSWASMTGPFGNFCRGQIPHDVGEWEDVAEVLDCRITLKGEDPYGEVTEGWLKLRTGLEKLSPVDSAPSKQVWWMRTPNGSEKGSVCIFDTLARAERGRNSEVYALALTKTPRTCGEGKWSYHGIVVTPMLGTESTYERLGKVVFSGEEALGECAWMEDKKKLVEVILV